MRVLDAHQHFWQYDPAKHAWIDDSMQVIRRDFLPADLLPILQQNEVAGCIAVQADESEQETDFLIQLAKQYSFIKAVIGWVDLCAADIADRLQAYRSIPVVKGFRNILQAKDPGYMLHPDFIRGLKALQDAGFTYDILVFPRHLTAVRELLDLCPGQSFVIDHLAKPDIKQPLSGQWKENMLAIAQHPNVYCKLSGMITEADWHSWTKETIFPYLDIVTKAFGSKRLLFGSDWPVCLVAGDYASVIGLVKDYFSAYSAEERERIFCTNALEFYHI